MTAQIAFFAVLGAIVCGSLVALCVQWWQETGRVIDRHREEAFNVYTDQAIALTEDEVEAAGLQCSCEGCESPAIETLFLRDQVGHVHDCSTHAALLREWCDVVHGEPLIDGECMAVVCTGDHWIWVGQPRPLGDGS